MFARMPHCPHRPITHKTITVKLLPALLLLSTLTLHAQLPNAASPSPADTASPTPALTGSALPGSSPTAIPRAQPVDQRELVTRLQIFLDQQEFGPGIIDGRWGEFTGKALVHYARAHNLQVSPAIYDQLPLDTVYPIYTSYTITPQDVKTVGPLPTKPSEEAKVKVMPYPDLLTFIEERYHASPDFLRNLNKGMNLDNLKAGDTVRVPNVAPFKIEDVKPEKLKPRPEFALRSIYVNTRDKTLDLYDGPRLVAFFPITPGSKSLPAPPGIWNIVGLVTLPEFRWDEEMLMHGKRSANAFQIPSGPRNPVGVLWCALNKTGIGIHGTNVPETIGRAGSHGCIRLANWDAIRFSKLVTPGIPVTIE
jgi:lipoprotein-anchoring transpeptidase ErfK/SrfK